MDKARKKPSSGAFKRLRGLYCFDEMDKKVKAGVSVEEVARWLQEDLMQLPEVKRETLVRQLYRYKASLPPGQIVTAPPQKEAKQNVKENCLRNYNRPNY